MKTTVPSNPTVSMSGSSRAKPPFHGAEPAAASTRPQFGSRPNAAVLTSGDVAIRRAIASASSGEDAPPTSISSSTVAPSPSSTICRASDEQTVSRAAASCRVTRRGPLEIGRAVREQHHRVVRRALAVDGDPVEARVDGGAEQRAGLARAERVVGRNDREHRGEARVDHSGALRHTADDEAVARNEACFGP